MTQVVVDSSALIAILFQEEGCEAIHRYLRNPDIEMLIGAPTLLETLMVLSGRGRQDADVILGTLLAGKRHRIVDFDDGMVRMAHAAFLAFGRGRHPARLNFGDCMAYAVARTFDVPLVFKGDDFARTDIRPAL